MSKVICDREDLVAIADAVRSKTGSSDEMSLGQIASGVEGISGGSSGAVETCTVEISATNVSFHGYAITSFDGSEIQCSHAYNSGGLGMVTLENVVCGSAITVYFSGQGIGATIGGGIEVVGTIGGNVRVFKAPIEPDVTGIITGYNDL